MTIDTSLTEIDTDMPCRGRTFTYFSGQGIVLMPACDDDMWVILNPGTHTVETIRLGHVAWSLRIATDEEILTGLVNACQTTFRRAMEGRAEAERLDATICEIREYAIDKHRDGHFCRDGLNEALEHFGLDRYDPRYTATIALTATAEINADTPDDARSRLRHLIDGVAYSGDEHTDDLDITIDELEISEIESA